MAKFADPDLVSILTKHATVFAIRIRIPPREVPMASDGTIGITYAELCIYEYNGKNYPILTERFGSEITGAMLQLTKEEGLEWYRQPIYGLVELDLVVPLPIRDAFTHE